MGAASAEIVTRGRRPLDAPVNLVPYVDILMTLMVFLVMCAVFTQLSALTVGSASSGTATTAVETPTLSLRMTATSIAVERDGQRVEVPRATGRLDGAALEAALRTVGKDVDTATLQSDDGVLYNDIVEVIDLARGAGVTRVSLEPTAS